MPAHCALEVGFRRLAEVVELGVERVELEEVSMAPFRRAWTGVTGLPAIVEAFAIIITVEIRRRLWNAVYDPVHEGALRRGRVWCVRIVGDEREGASAAWSPGPGERWCDAATIARVNDGNRAVGVERG